MTRRTLLKLIASMPFLGPAVAKALTKAPPAVRRRYPVYLPAYFPGWNKQCDGLESVAAWALEIERARLPSGLNYPREGQVWEAVRDCEIVFCANIRKLPFELSRARIEPGEKVRVVHVDGSKPVFVSFVRMGQPVPEQIDPFSALRLKTVRTVENFCDKGCDQTFFLEGFKLVSETA